MGRDFRTAIRSLRRSGALASVAVLMLAAAIGAATTTFSIGYAVLLRALPIANPERLLVLWGRDDAHAQQVVEVSLADLRAWRSGQTAATAIEVFGSVNWGELRITSVGEPFGATMNAVSAGFFDVLGSRPLLGRTFRAEDDQPGAPGRVILSEQLWRRRFSSDPSIVGKAVRVDEGAEARPYEILGVMPRDFRIPSGADVWVPIGPVLGAVAKEINESTDGVRAMYAVARLAPDATAENAMTELTTIARREDRKQGLANSETRVIATPLEHYLLGSARPALYAIAGATFMLLMIGCANAAGLLLVQAAGRRHEVAVRFALGARRWQIVRQLLWESVILSVVAAGIGTGIAYVSFHAIVGLVPIQVPRLDDAAIDVRAVLYATLVSVLIAIAVCVLPAWQYSSRQGALLQQRSPGGIPTTASGRTRKLLAAGQIAAAVILLTGAGLFARSFLALLRLDLGFDPNHVLTFQIQAPQSAYPTKEQRRALVDHVLERATHVRNVVAVGAVFQRPFANGPIGMDSSVVLEGQPLTAAGAARNPMVNWEAVSPGYFSTMEIRLVEGRLFSDADRDKTTPVVIVSEGLARRLWPGRNPIGNRLLTLDSPSDAQHPGWQTVVGVVADARYREVEAPRYDVYLPHRQAQHELQHFVLRVAGDPVSVLPELKAAVASLDNRITVEGVTTMNQIVANVFAPWRFSTIVFTIFSVMAVGFAAVGVAALIAYAVAQRTREIGVRMALGAQSYQVVALMVREGFWMTAGGLTVGVFAAWAMRKSVASLLFGVSAADPITFAVVPMLLSVCALLAIYLPATRAARIDPAVTLRHE